MRAEGVGGCHKFLGEEEMIILHEMHVQFAQLPVDEVQPAAQHALLLTHPEGHGDAVVEAQDLRADEELREDLGDDVEDVGSVPVHEVQEGAEMSHPAPPTQPVPPGAVR